MIGAALTLGLPVVQCSQRHLNIHHTKESSTEKSPAAAGLQGRCRHRGLPSESFSSLTCLRTTWQVCPLEVTATFGLTRLLCELVHHRSLPLCIMVPALHSILRSSKMLHTSQFLRVSKFKMPSAFQHQLLKCAHESHREFLSGMDCSDKLTRSSS